ncbi:MAG TPA: hypothetical protein VHB77_04070, partial [Planctomycetaceae bacterium]|nr:hypothetical protein [Planctomycetaceae bacterium]
MNSEDVSRLIEHQIGDLGSLPNSHGVELHRCLTNPTLIQVTHRRVLNGKTKDSTEIVWLVLEERPDEKDGYKIIFNEKMRSFG